MASASDLKSRFTESEYGEILYTKDVYDYTIEEIIKTCTALEIHLKQMLSSGEDNVCKECITKHLFELEKLAEEGIGFSKDLSDLGIFTYVYNIARLIRKGGLPPKEAAKYLRLIRKSLEELISLYSPKDREPYKLESETEEPKSESAGEAKKEVTLETKEEKEEERKEKEEKKETSETKTSQETSNHEQKHKKIEKIGTTLVGLGLGIIIASSLLYERKEKFPVLYKALQSLGIAFLTTGSITLIKDSR